MILLISGRLFEDFSGNKNLRWLNGPYFIIILQKLEFEKEKKNLNLDLEENLGEISVRSWRNSEGPGRSREELKIPDNSREWMRVSDGWAKDGQKDAKKTKM